MNKALVLPLILIVLLLAAYFLPVVDWLTATAEWIQANRTWSWIVFILLYIAATVLMLPGSLLTLAAGFLFGLGMGYVVVAIASVAGASLAFLVGRFLARDWVEGRLVAMPRFAALDRAVQNRGWLIVLLTRLSPLFPFNLLNYALGLTSVKFPTYVLVSWVGMIPGTLLYVYLGSVTSSLTQALSGDVGETPFSGWLLYVGLAATLVMALWIARFATTTLNRELGDEGMVAVDDASTGNAEAEEKSS